jgi:stearoyl-CoA desaturase (delta-9 desaturase)
MAGVTGRLMNTNQKIRSIQFANFILSIVAVWYAISTGQLYLLAVSYLVFVVLCPIGISAGLHRLLSHRSYSTSPLIEKILSIISVYATVGSPIAWVAVHRSHHGFSDKENDPHSPYQNGQLTVKGVVSAWTGYGAPTVKIPISYVKDLSRNSFQRWLHDNYFKLLLVPVIILFLINPIMGLFLYSLPATLALNTTSVVNVLGHSHGYRNHDTKDFSTNSWIANLISLGEGWHNNHHGAAGRYTTQENPKEWDLIGMFIDRIRTR